MGQPWELGGGAIQEETVTSALNATTNILAALMRK